MNNFIAKLALRAAGRGVLPFVLVAALCHAGIAYGAARPAVCALPSPSGGVSVTSAANGDVLTLEYAFPPAVAEKGDDGLYSVRVDGLEASGNAGAPALPSLQVNAAIPYGKSPSSVKVTLLDPEEIASGIMVRHVGESRPHGMVSDEETPRDLSIYGKDAFFPESAEGESFLQRKRGVSLYVTSICPVKYNPAQGKVVSYRRASVEITLSRPVRTRAVAEPAALPARGARDKKNLLPGIDNPEVLDSYPENGESSSGRESTQTPANSVRGAASPQTQLRAPASQSAATMQDEPQIPAFTKVPSLPCAITDDYYTDGYEHVIITTEALLPLFSGFVRYRRAQGRSTTAVTVEAIEACAAYRGRDLPETIRNFIKDAYLNWNTDYVLLGGDHELIPARMLTASVSGMRDSIPSDLYYQCLDGDFDANGNGIFGEPEDLPDLFAEVGVGRVPVKTLMDVSNWTYKVKVYESAAASFNPAVSGSLMLGEHLGFGGISEYAEPMMEQIRLGSAQDGYYTAGFKNHKVYASGVQTLYDSSRTEWTSSDLTSLLNSGRFSIINHLGHSSPWNNMKLTDKDVKTLRNKIPFFVYSQGCEAGRFDEDCIAETFLLMDGGGAYAGVWNARFGWGMADSTDGPSQRCNRYFWDALFTSRAYRVYDLGSANALSHEKNASIVNVGPMRWVYYETNLFGDPMQQIFGIGGELSFDREAYRTDATASIVLKSPDAAGSSEVVTLSAYRTVESANSSTGAAETNDTVVATVAVSCSYAGAEGVNSVFRGSVDLASLPEIKEGDRLEISWEPNFMLRGVAWLDDTPPEIGGIGVLARNGSVRVDFSANEGVKARVSVGQTAPPGGSVSHADEFSLSHSVSVGALEADSIYYVSIEAEDKAGNIAYSPLPGSSPEEYHSVVLAALTEKALFNMEDGAPGWKAEGCWQLGMPSYGPEASSRCFGTVIDGRYPDNANDSLVSPPIVTGLNPTISFRHWYDTELTERRTTGNLKDADCGYVEVLCDGVWHDVSRYAQSLERVCGKSNGWEDATIALPSSFAGKTIRVRFRFVSDNIRLSGANPAGWYVDQVRFSDVPLSGLRLDLLSIDDSVLGNGNGIAEPGENLNVELGLFNLGNANSAIHGLGGTVSLQMAGTAPGLVTLGGANSVSVSYGTVEGGKRSAQNAVLPLSISEKTPAGTVVTLVQSLTGSDGKIYEGKVAFTVRRISSISGKVLEGNRGPLPGAEIRATSSSETITAVTAPDGTYTIANADSNVVYTVAASYGLAGATKKAVTPAKDVDFLLEFARPAISPESFSFTLDQTLSPSEPIETASFVTISNPGGTAALDYAMEVEYFNADSQWIGLDETLETGRIAPDGTITIPFSISAMHLPPGLYTAAIRLLDIGGTSCTEPVSARVTLTINPVDAIAFDGYAIDDDPERLNPEAIEVNADADGAPEYGETLLLSFSIANNNPHVDKRDFVIDSVSCDPAFDGATGVEIVTDSNILRQNGLVFPIEARVLPAESKVTGTLLLRWFASETTEKVKFTLGGSIGTDPVSFEFDVTNGVMNASHYLDQLSGRVLGVNCPPATPRGATNGVENVVVTLEAPDGTLLSSSVTTNGGAFYIDGIVPGVSYWCEAKPLEGSCYVPPRGFYYSTEYLPFPTNGTTYNMDIVGSSYGESAPLLVLDSVTAKDENQSGESAWDDRYAGLDEMNDGDGFVDAGELLRLGVALRNAGASSSSKLNATLEAVSAGGEDVISVVKGDSMPDETPAGLVFGIGELRPYPNAITPGRTGEMGDFVLKVKDNAQEGDVQRFILTVTTDDEPAKVWHRTVVLTVENMAAVLGKIEYEGASQARIKDLAAKTSLSLVRDDGMVFYANPIAAEGGEYAEYSFKELERANYTLKFDSVPVGYVTPETIDIFADRNLERDFLLEKWPLKVLDGNGNEMDAILMEVDEGASATNAVTLSLSGTPADVTARIVFARSTDDILPKDAVPQPLSSSDWRKLPAESYDKEELEIIFKDGTSVAEREAYCGRHGLEAIHHFSLFAATVARAKAGRELSLDGGSYLEEIIVDVRPSAKYKLNSAPNDPMYPLQWALSNYRQTGGTMGADTGVEKAWEKSFGSKEIIVAVCDSGVDYTHSDLEDNIWINRGEIPGNGIDDDGNGFIDDVRGWNPAGEKTMFGITPPNNNVMDENAHGTHVAGTIGAVGDNGIGISGINRAVSLMPVKIGYQDGTIAPSARVAIGIEYALVNGAHVSNHSWGGPVASPIIERAIAAGLERGHLFVIAAGNSAENITDIPQYPASYSDRYENIIVVSAADHDDRLAYFSSFSPTLSHLAAPGKDIVSTIPQNHRGALAGKYMQMSGTSMATPHVTGAAALLYAISPSSNWRVVKKAILDGVRHDPSLKEFVKTSGHLDIGRSVGLLGSDWLCFASDGGIPVAETNFTLSSSQSVDFRLLANDRPSLSSGEYAAALRFEGTDAAMEIPVYLSVNPAAVLEEDGVRFTDGDGNDIPPVAGANGFLRFKIANTGSRTLENGPYAIYAANAAEPSQSFDFGYLEGRSVTESEASFAVALEDGGDGFARFAINLHESSASAASLLAQIEIGIELEEGSPFAVNILTEDGRPVEGAAAEIVGANGGYSAVSGPAGRASFGLVADGNYTLRIAAEGYSRTETDVSSRDGTVNAVLKERLVNSSSPVANLEIPQGASLSATNAVRLEKGEAHSVKVVLSETARIALVDDGENNLSCLVPVLERMGYKVDLYSNNFSVVQYFNPKRGTSEIVQYVRHSADDALFAPYDFVIAYIEGEEGFSRPVYENEVAGYASYIERGGKVLFTGCAPLSRPDNPELASILGIGESSLDRIAFDSVGPFAANGGSMGGPFGDFDAVLLPVSSPAVVEAAREIASAASPVLAYSGDATVAKIVSGPVSKKGGRGWFWGGNASDWKREGAMLDLLRNLLYRELTLAKTPSWISAGSSSLALAPGAETGLVLAVNGDGALVPGEYSASVLLLDEATGDADSVIVELKVAPPSIRAHNLSGRVTSSGGRALKGDGTYGTSCVYQLIYAGVNGVADAPNADGSPGGDDIALLLSSTKEPFGLFGASGDSVNPDEGKFDNFFDLIPLEPGSAVYARAWNAPSMAAATSYGDSALYAIKGIPSEEADFGSWTLSEFTGVVTDVNGDTVPEAWMEKYRPGLDPLEPRTALPQELVMEEDNQFSVADPVRVVASEKFLFVLDRASNSLLVHSREKPNVLIHRYCALDAAARPVAGSGNLEFKYPSGLAIDPRAGEFRIAVADTGNGRVQTALFDPDTGMLSFEKTIGYPSPTAGTSAPHGSFADPSDVSIMKSGQILVADRGNRRVQRFKADGTHLSSYLSQSFGNILSASHALRNGEAGFWVADGERACVSFFRYPAGTASSYELDPVVAYYGPAGSAFVNPTDAKAWNHGNTERILVADSDNRRVLLLSQEGELIAKLGDYSDKTLQDYEQIGRPYGIFPIQGENRIYVADEAKGRVLWFGIQIDHDGDGMDDLWEDLNGLDSSYDDSLEDLDGDGLSNIGEYRAGTDPRKADSDGDGQGDLYEMNHLVDPLDAESKAIAPANLLSAAADPALIRAGESTTVKLAFDRPFRHKITYILRGADGAVLHSGEILPQELGEAVFTYASPIDAEAQPVSGEFAIADCDPPVRIAANLFEIATAAAEKEEVEWRISAIEYRNASSPELAISWEMPTEGIVPGENLIFRLFWREAVDGSPWQHVDLPSGGEVSVPESHTGEIGLALPLSQFQGKKVLLFRLVWLNREKTAAP